MKTTLRTSQPTTPIARAIFDVKLPVRYIATKIGINYRLLQKYQKGDVKPHPLRELVIVDAIQNL